MFDGGSRSSVRRWPDDAAYAVYREDRSDPNSTKQLLDAVKRHAAMVSLQRLGTDDPDVIGEVVLRVITHEPKFRADSLFSTWVHRIALNVCADRLRWIYKMREVPLECLPSQKQPFMEAKPVPGLFTEQVMAQLSMEEQDLLQRKLDGDTNETVAAALGITLPATKSRWLRLRHKLQGVLNASNAKNRQ